MIKLMPHQETALLKLRNGNILKGPVGSGKSITALSYYNDIETVERLIVITTAKKRDSGDWQAEARLLGLFPEVDSWHNIKAYENIEGAFFIFDEQRIVGSGAWVNSFLKITKKNLWILLSATPGDTWLDYIPVFLANGFYRTRTEFMREHVVFARFVKYPKVERYISTGRLARHLRDILVEMPYEKHTVRHEIDVYAEYDRERYDLVWRKRWNYLEDRPIRHVSELFSLMRRVVNTDSSRISSIRDILLTHPRIIVFYNFDYELEILRGLSPEPTWPPWETGPTGASSGSTTATAEDSGVTSTPSSFALAEWNGHKHEPIPDTDGWVYLVQYAAGAEGWNCTETDTVVFYSLSYSYRMSEQAKGRIDRLDTPFTDLYYYGVFSPAGIDHGIRNALGRKKNFNELRWLKSSGTVLCRSHLSDVSAVYAGQRTYLRQIRFFSSSSSSSSSIYIGGSAETYTLTEGEVKKKRLLSQTARLWSSIARKTCTMIEGNRMWLVLKTRILFFAKDGT